MDAAIGYFYFYFFEELFFLLDFFLDDFFLRALRGLGALPQTQVRVFRSKFSVSASLRPVNFSEASVSPVGGVGRSMREKPKSNAARAI